MILGKYKTWTLVGCRQNLGYAMARAMAWAMAHPVAYPMAHPKFCILTNDEEQTTHAYTGNNLSI